MAFGFGGLRARPGLRPAPALPLRSLHPQLVAVLGHAVRDPGDHNLGVIRRTTERCVLHSAELGLLYTDVCL